MQITFHGKNCFLVKNGDVIIAFDSLANLKDKINIATSSLEGEAKNGEKNFDWPGEYESNGVTITGISTFQGPRSLDAEISQEKNTVFLLGIDKMKVCHLGHLGHKFSPEQVETLGDIDVLFIPIGSESKLTPERLKEVVNQIDPRVIIPMGELTAENLIALGKLLSYEVKPAEEKIEITKNSLPIDKTDLIILKIVN